MIKKILTVALSFCLIILSPGVASYQAFAASFNEAPPETGAKIQAFQLSVGNIQDLPVNQFSIEKLGAVPNELNKNLSIPLPEVRAPLKSSLLPAAFQRERKIKPQQTQSPLNKNSNGINQDTKPSARETRKEIALSNQIRMETMDWEKTAPETLTPAAKESPLPFLSRLTNGDLKTVPNFPPAPAIGKNAKKLALGLGALAGISLALPHLTLAALALSLSAAASIVVHEAAHLFMLRRLGDDTAAQHGMAKVNPFSFINPLTTIGLPVLSAVLSSAFLGFPLAFGWGKPIPVDFNKLKNPQKDTALVAAAGPLSNLALAAAAAVAAIASGGTAAIALLAFAKINLGLAAFNLLPLPQMDGGKIAIGLLSPKLYQRWIRNPSLPDNYQGTYQKLYEGPANLLTRLRLSDPKRVNLFTMATTFAAFAAFSAAGLTWFGGPLAFVSLACAYDYYCVREKIQNEEAVQSLMGLLQGFSANLAKMAEADERIQSSINPETVEHVLKQTLEDVLDQTIDSEGFAALSNEEKWARFEAAYMDGAVQALKASGMSADDPETIRAVLKSDMARKELLDPLKSWMERYEVLKKWKSPGRKEKTQDSTQEKGKESEAGRATMTGLLMGLGLGAAAIFAPHLAFAQHLAASAGFGALIAGSLTETPQNTPEESKSFDEAVQDPKYKFSPKEQQFLHMFLTDMTAEESDGQPVSGREQELSQVHKIVTAPRGDITSVILYGPKGVGKTSIVEKYAQALALSASGAAPTALSLQKMRGRFLLKLNLGHFLTADNLPQTLQILLDLLSRFNEADKKSGNKIILFIDEVHELVKGADGEKMATMLKEVLGRGKLSVIAATTEKEYKRFIEPDEAFTRRFYPVYVREETPQETLRTLEGARSYLENLYDMKINPEALKAAAELSDSDQELQLPGRAFKYLNAAAREADFSFQRDRLNLIIGSALKEIQYAIKRLAEEMSRTETVTQNLKDNDPTTISLYNLLADLSRRLIDLSRARSRIPPDGRPQVTDELVKREIASQTGVEEGQLSAGNKSVEKYLEMEKIISERVVGQDEAVHSISEAVRMNKAGLSSPNRPMGVFYLTGPTGVGKTHLGKELARFLFDDPNALVRIDMSEFQESHSVARLIGSPPGYVGHGEGGQLTEKIRRKPYSVILFDEIEKAHPDVWFLLLQILGEGRLTDGQGRTVDFSHTIILMTSNLGMREIDLGEFVKKFEALKAESAEAAKTGDQAKVREIEAKKEALSQEISRETKIKAKEVTDRYFKQVFPPEFRGRLHADPLVFERITPATAKTIIEINLKELASLLAKSGNELTWTPALVSFLADQGFSIDLGARPLKNALDHYVTQPIARKLLESYQSGVLTQKITADVDHGEVRLSAEPRMVRAPEKKDPQEAAADEIFNQALAQALKMAADPAFIEPSEELVHSWALSALAAYPKETAIDGKPKNISADDEVQSEKPQLPKTNSPQVEMTAPATSSFFNANEALDLSPQTQSMLAAHYDSARKDAQILNLYKTLRQTLKEAGYPEETTERLLKTVENVQNPYLGFLPLFISQAKDSTPKDQRETPLKIFHEIGKDSVKILIHRNGPMNASEQVLLKTHFAGLTPKSPEEARNRAEALNVRGKDGRRLFFDLNRVLSQIPGAKIGWATQDKARGKEGTDYWIELPKVSPQEAAPAAANAPPLSITDADQAKQSLHDFTLALMAQKEERGSNVRMAAADLLAEISTLADLAKARDWMRFDPGDLSRWYPEVAAASQILAKHGNSSDEKLLRDMAQKLDQIQGDSFTATKNRLAEALALVFAKDIENPRSRLALITEFQSGEMVNPIIRRSLALALANSNAVDPKIDNILLENFDYEPLYRYMKKNDPEFSKFLYGIRHDVVLTPLEAFAVSENGTKEDIHLFMEYAANSVANAELYMNKADIGKISIVAASNGRLLQRLGLYPQLRSDLWTGVDRNSHPNLSANSQRIFIQLIMAIEAAKVSGDATDLDNLENIMEAKPESVHYLHEVTQQKAAEAWAAIVVRTGLITQYMKPQPNGQQAKIMEMLANTNPILNKAALEALRLYFNAH